ncbi:MAG: ATP-binding cassette domain-containing protein [Anaerolineae bacterium]|nr:ATP-binding cassette domain-containing protein [Anaerolineae bacterium]
MNPDGIDIFHGGYSAYLLQRQERWEYTERVYREEKARLLKDVDFIQRNWVRDSTHARALGLLKKVSRELSIIDKYGLMTLRSGKQWAEMDLRADHPLDVIEAIRKVNEITIPTQRPPAVHPRLPVKTSGGALALQAHAAVIGYPGHDLFSTGELVLRRGICTALIGPNGSGKTTFLKVLLGELEPLKGEVNVSPGLKVGYFAQAHDALTATHTVLDEIQSRKPMLPETARKHLAGYLFRGDDVFKPVNSLSGGERARLALAILALEGTSLLLLDEPTNHLDIPAREALHEMLQSYMGTILLVSHDRFLINNLASQIWELRQHQLMVFDGNYREYILRRNAGNSNALRQTLLVQRPMARDNSKETRRRTQAMDQLEERIRQQESAVQKLSFELQKAGEKEAFDRIQKLSVEFARAQANLDSLMEEWEKIAV